MGNALDVPKLAATGEANPINPLHRQWNRSPSREGSSFIFEAVLATLSNMARGVSPGKRYPEDKVCIPSSVSHFGAIFSVINSFPK
jgi:hypothetical protein